MLLLKNSGFLAIMDNMLSGEGKSGFYTNIKIVCEFIVKYPHRSLLVPLPVKGIS
jgi:hypothetical protein